MIILFISQVPMVQSQVPMVQVPMAQSPEIVVTTTVVADLVENVIGGNFNIYTLINKGVDVHDYQASAEDSSALENADIVFFLGGGVEEGLDKTLIAMEDDKKAFSLIKSIPNDKLLKTEDGIVDPHFWLDPTIIEYPVVMIRDVMTAIDPDNIDAYTRNSVDFMNRLITLDEWITERVNELDVNSKFLVTQHASFEYFANQYEFQTKSLAGISTNDEAGIAEIDDMASYLRTNRISVIFLESTVPDTQAQAVIDATQAIGWTVKNGGVLFTGSVGDGNSSTYIGMMSANVNLIVDGILNPPVQQEAPVSFLWILLGISMIAVVKRKKEGALY